MATIVVPVRGNRSGLVGTFVLAISLLFTVPATALEPLLIPVGKPHSRGLPDHVAVSQRVRVNPRALQSPVISIDLMGETVVALRDHEQKERGLKVWVGHIEGQPMDRVVVTSKGRAYSAVIQRGVDSFQLGSEASGENRLDQWLLDALPADDAEEPPVVAGSAGDSVEYTDPAGDTIEHDLLVVYTEQACRFLGSCSQLEADIVTAVADLNAAYQASGVFVRINIVGTAMTRYDGLDAGDALAHLSGQNDGWMDEVHSLRDMLGADIVSLIYSGEGCGIGYINAGADRAFNVTDVPCLLSNRTLAHEIAHNQGAHHDRVTLGTPSVTTYNYGYRRCDVSSEPDYSPAPHFRTIMSYPCGSAPRRGVFSTPEHSLDGVALGIDPDTAPSQGTDNARRINERAAIVADFRARPRSAPPTPPAALSAVATGPDAIRLSWTDQSTDERAFIVQVMNAEREWVTVATLPANTESWTHGGLQAGRTYQYRVYASNASGGSGYGEIVSANTLPLPSFVDDHAVDGERISGSTLGGLAALNRRDGDVFVLTESPVGKGKNRQAQTFGHVWAFDVSGGTGGVIAYIQAWVSGQEGARFWYSSDDGRSRQPMLTITSNARESRHAFVLPQETLGRVYIGVEDAEQVPGEAVDRTFIEEIVIRSWDGTAGAPAAPRGLEAVAVASSSVILAFTDASETEWGFTVWRATRVEDACRRGRIVGAIGDADGEVSFTDVSATPGQAYWYSVSAFNGAGESVCSDPVKVTTLAHPAIELTWLETHRVRGVQQVELGWAADGPVDVYRDGHVLHESLEGEFLTDVIGARGNGRYEYRVCLAATAFCSDSGVADF